MSWKTDQHDQTILNLSIQTGLTAVDQIQKCLADATEEVKSLVKTECDLIFECRVCRNLFRSLANFIAHKRVYCKSLSANSQSLQGTSLSRSPESEVNGGKSRSGQHSREQTPDLSSQFHSDSSNDSDDLNLNTSVHSRLLTKSTGKSAAELNKPNRAKSNFNFYAKLVKRVETKIASGEAAAKGTAAVVIRKTPTNVPHTVIENGVQRIEDRQAALSRLFPQTAQSQEKVVMVIPEDPNAGKHIVNGMTLRARQNPGEIVSNSKEITDGERQMYERLSQVPSLDLKNMSCLAANDCSKRFSTLEALASHFTMIHPKLLQPPPHCLVCGEQFEAHQLMLIHAGTVHKELMQEELNEAFADELKLVHEANSSSAADDGLPISRKRPIRTYGRQAKKAKRDVDRPPDFLVVEQEDKLIDDASRDSFSRGPTEESIEKVTASPKDFLLKQSSPNSSDNEGHIRCVKCDMVMTDSQMMDEHEKTKCEDIRLKKVEAQKTTIVDSNETPMEEETQNAEEIYQMFQHLAKHSSEKPADMDELVASCAEETSCVGEADDSDSEPLRLNLNLSSATSEVSSTPSSPNKETVSSQRSLPGVTPMGIEESEDSDDEELSGQRNLDIIRDKCENSLKKPTNPEQQPSAVGPAVNIVKMQTGKYTPTILRRKARLVVSHTSDLLTRVRRSVYLDEAKARRLHNKTLGYRDGAFSGKRLQTKISAMKSLTTTTGDKDSDSESSTSSNNVAPSQFTKMKPKEKQPLSGGSAKSNFTGKKSGRQLVYNKNRNPRPFSGQPPTYTIRRKYVRKKFADPPATSSPKVSTTISAVAHPATPTITRSKSSASLSPHVTPVKAKVNKSPTRPVEIVQKRKVGRPKWKHLVKDAEATKTEAVRPTAKDPNCVSAITCDVDEQAGDDSSPAQKGEKGKKGSAPMLHRSSRVRRAAGIYNSDEYFTDLPGSVRVKSGPSVTHTGPSRPSSRTDSITELVQDAKANRVRKLSEKETGKGAHSASAAQSDEVEKLAQFQLVVEQLIDPNESKCLVCKRLCRNLKFAKEHCVSHIQAFRFKCSACNFKAYGKALVSKHVVFCPSLYDSKGRGEAGNQPHIIAIKIESNAEDLLEKFSKSPRRKQQSQPGTSQTKPTGGVSTIRGIPT